MGKFTDPPEATGSFETPQLFKQLVLWNSNSLLWRIRRIEKIRSDSNHSISLVNTNTHMFVRQIPQIRNKNIFSDLFRCDEAGVLT